MKKKSLMVKIVWMGLFGSDKGVVVSQNATIAPAQANTPGNVCIALIVNEKVKEHAFFELASNFYPESKLGKNLPNHINFRAIQVSLLVVHHFIDLLLRFYIIFSFQ